MLTCQPKNDFVGIIKTEYTALSFMSALSEVIGVRGYQMSDKEKKAEEEIKEGLGPITRREFAIGSIAVLGATADSNATVHAITQTAPKAAGKPDSPPAALSRQPASPSSRIIKLTVNKWKYELQVEPESVLRDVLRNQLGFLSVKDMCNGYGACGSCTVIADGRPVLSCLTLAVECDGMSIETAEGVAEEKPELIEAYVMNHCMQCGYCTPGFIVTAKALLDRISKPTETDIREALGGNICRCGTYPQHPIAILEATRGRAQENG
jgi:aerobic-type carbon monoxide dehydrogenase small subunit (CoxS/CutS family)